MIQPWLERRDGSPMTAEDWIAVAVILVIILFDLYVIAHSLTHRDDG